MAKRITNLLWALFSLVLVELVIGGIEMALSLPEPAEDIISVVFNISFASILFALGLHLYAFNRGSKLWNMGRLLVGQASCFLVFAVVCLFIEIIVVDSRFLEKVIGVIGVLCFLLFIALSVLVLIRLYAYLQQYLKEKRILIGFIVLCVVSVCLEIFGYFFWGEDNTPIFYDILTIILCVFDLALVEWLLTLFIRRFNRLKIHSDEDDE